MARDELKGTDNGAMCLEAFDRDRAAHGTCPL
jgi:hypothetical protein